MRRKEAKNSKGAKISKQSSQLSLSHTSEDVQIAEYWDNLLKDKDVQKDPTTAERFFGEMHGRLLRKFGTISHAFKLIDTSGDGFINFNEWQNMLAGIHLKLHERGSRWIFGCASGREKELSLFDFKVTLLQPSVKKFKESLRRYRRFQDSVHHHLQTFLTELMTADQDIKVASVDRFQRKMTLPFCRRIWEKFQSIDSIRAQMNCKCIQDVVLEREELKEMATKSIGSFGDGALLLESQVPLLMNLSARVGNYRGNAISVVDLLSAIIIVSGDTDRGAKLKLMFEVFDRDEDSVLEDYQIKDLFCCLCKAKPIFHGNDILLKEEGALAFQEELSEQEGLRNYECAYWHLQSTGHRESAVNWTELWTAIKDQPDVLISLIPAPPEIRWVLDPIAVQIEDSIPRSTTPARAQRQVADLLNSHPTLQPLEEYARISKKPLRRSSVLHDLWQKPGSRPVSREPRACSSSCSSATSGHRPASRDISGLRPSSKESRPASREPRSMFSAWEMGHRSAFTLDMWHRPASREPRPGSRSKFSAPQDDHWQDMRRPQTSEFRKDLTVQFQRRLRRLGYQRVSELKEGFERHTSLSSPRSSAINDTGSVSDLSSPRQSAPQLASHVSSLPRLDSRDALKGLSGGQIDHLPRVGSAPHGFQVVTSQSRLPIVESSKWHTLKWGTEGADRHKLLVAARDFSEQGNQRCTHQGPHEKYGYKCHLCERMHLLSQKDRIEEEFEEV